MIKRTFIPAFRITLQQKALNLGLQSARTVGVVQLMNACAALGHGQSDHSALVQALEAQANHKVASA